MTGDFLFREIDEKEKKEIRKQAKSIMDSFAKKLSEIDKDIPEKFIERDDFEREEGNSKGANLDRDIMFDNAPNKTDKHIVAEKGGWK